MRVHTLGKRTATAVYTGRDVPLSMSGVHLHTIAQSSALNSAYGVYAAKSVEPDSTSSDTVFMRMSARVYIEGGTIASTAAGKSAQAVTLTGSYNSLLAESITDTIRGVILSAMADSSATAVSLNASVEVTSGVPMAANAYLDRLDVHAIARINPAVAFGVRGTENVVNGVLCYASASAVVEGGTYRATAYNGAYGVSATVNKLSKKTFSSYPRLIARNVHFVAKAKTTARGMSLTALAEAYGCSLYAEADSIYAYGSVWLLLDRY